MSTAAKGTRSFFRFRPGAARRGERKGLVSGFPLELIDERFQVPLRAEHFVVEFVTPGGKAEFENLVDDAIRVVRSVEFDHLVKEIIRDANGVNRRVPLGVPLQVFLDTLENPEVDVFALKFFLFHFRHPLYRFKKIIEGA
jgi:hypothetical protein